MGLLTLIIIGEGIIVMLKAVNVVEKGSSYVYGVAWRASSFSIVTASIGIIVSLITQQELDGAETDQISSMAFTCSTSTTRRGGYTMDRFVSNSGPSFISP